MNNICLNNSNPLQSEEGSKHFSEQQANESTFSKTDNSKQDNEIQYKHNEDFICDLCKKTFQDFEQFKRHDLEHSLEEANEKLTDIDHLILPSGFRTCPLCDKKFSCDEELIDHSVIHSELKNELGLKEKSSDKNLQSSMPNALNVLENAEETLSIKENVERYPVLRQQVIKTKNGSLYVRFILIDQENSHIEEFSRLLHKEEKSKVKPKKSRLNFSSKSQIARKNIIQKEKAKSDSNILQSSDCEPEIVYEQIEPKSAFKRSSRVKNKPNFPAKSQVENKNVSQKHITAGKHDIDLLQSSDTSDSELEVVFENNDLDTSVKHPRRSKLRAMKKKLWSYTPEIEMPKPKLCTVCNKSFSTAKKCEEHVLTQHSSKVSCKECDKKFPSESLLKRHKTIYHRKDGSELFPCHRCHLTFFSQNSLNLHSKEHTKTKGKIACEDCHRSFINPKNLATHICSESTQFRCKICSSTYSSRTHLKRHLIQVHKINENEANDLMPPCLKTKRKSHSYNHIKNVSSSGQQEKTILESSDPSLTLPPVATCVLCKNKFSDISSFRSHLFDVHLLKQSEVESIVHSLSSSSGKKEEEKEVISDTVEMQESLFSGDLDSIKAAKDNSVISENKDLFSENITNKFVNWREMASAFVSLEHMKVDEQVKSNQEPSSFKDINTNSNVDEVEKSVSKAENSFKDVNINSNVDEEKESATKAEKDNISKVEKESVSKEEKGHVSIDLLERKGNKVHPGISEFKSQLRRKINEKSLKKVDKKQKIIHKDSSLRLRNPISLRSQLKPKQTIQKLNLVALNEINAIKKLNMSSKLRSNNINVNFKRPVRKINDAKVNSITSVDKRKSENVNPKSYINKSNSTKLNFTSSVNTRNSKRINSASPVRKLNNKKVNSNNSSNELNSARVNMRNQSKHTKTTLVPSKPNKTIVKTKTIVKKAVTQSVKKPVTEKSNKLTGYTSVKKTKIISDKKSTDTKLQRKKIVRQKN